MIRLYLFLLMAGAAMADFFTLNPRYERYELGVYPLEEETAQDINMHPVRNILGFATLAALGFFLFILLMTKRGDTSNLHLNVVNSLTDIFTKALVIGTVIFGPIGLIISRHTSKRYKQLNTNGVLLNGIISAIHNEESRYYSRGGETRGPSYIFVTYNFTTPERHNLSGEQMRVRDDLRDKPLPPVGTPIRVLYADDTTHVML